MSPRRSGMSPETTRMKKLNRQAASGVTLELRAVLISGFLNGGVHLTIL